MGNKKIFIEKDGKTESIEKTILYLMLIGDELRSHSVAHYVGQEQSIPIQLSTNFAEYKNQDLKHLQTALKPFNGFDSKKFKETFKKELLKQYEKQKDESIKSALAFALEKIGRRKINASFKKKELNKIQYEPFKALAVSRVNESDDQIYFRYLSNGLNETLIARLNDISKSVAQIKAIEHVDMHLNLSGKYTYKKLVRSVDEIYDKMFKGKSNEKSLSENVNEAKSNFEVLGRIDFILSESKYYQSIYNNFKLKF